MTSKAFGSNEFKVQVESAFGEAFLIAMDTIGRQDMYGITDIDAVELLAELMNVTPESRALDLCCGIGGPARWLAKNRGCQVTGVDISEFNINVAMERTQKAGIEGLVSYNLGNALKPPVEKGSFTHVYGCDAWVYMPDKSALYQTCREVLMPGGTLAFVDMSVTKPKTSHWFWEDYFGEHQPETIDVYHELLQAEGFEIVESRNIKEYATSALMRATHMIINKRDEMQQRLGALYSQFIEFAAAVIAEYEVGILDHVLIVARRI